MVDISDLKIRKVLLVSVRTRVASPTEKCLSNLYVGIIIPLAYVLYMHSFFFIRIYFIRILRLKFTQF